MSADIQSAGAVRVSSETLLSAQQLSVDKLPVLQGIFERLAPQCAEAMRDLVAVPTAFFVNQIETGNSWDVLESYEDSVAVIFKVPEWDTYLLVGLDRRFMFSLLEGMFGGDMSEPQFEATRPFTTLESRIGRAVCEKAASLFQTAFSSISTLTLIPERTETALDFTTLGQSSMTVITAQLLFQILDGGGRMFFMLPQAPLYPLRQKLERDRPSNQGISDPRWVRDMQNRVAGTEVNVAATIGAPDYPLLDIARFRIGQVIPLKYDAAAPVVLECDDERLFRCKLGQSQGLFTVELDAPIDHEQEFADGILASVQKTETA